MAGLLFGMGLAISNMTDPGRVTDFLDVTGMWDPTLLLVMGGALTITLPGFILVQKRPSPFFAEKYFLPTKKDLDASLISGAILFGIGWGIAGFCPGPAIASLVSLKVESVIFVTAMIGG
ncbi:MAG: putative membrane protein YedE/YeeE [Gammaproteobacteria bacterium]